MVVKIIDENGKLMMLDFLEFDQIYAPRFAIAFY